MKKKRKTAKRTPEERARSEELGRRLERRIAELNAAEAQAERRASS
jgi:hypothetical protein